MGVDGEKPTRCVDRRRCEASRMKCKQEWEGRWLADTEVVLREQGSPQTHRD